MRLDYFNLLHGKALIYNAPPNAGKDTMAEITSAITGADHLEFKAHLYHCTATIFNIPVEEFVRVASDRDLKGVPDKRLQLSYSGYKLLCEITGAIPARLTSMVCLTPREALICTSELIIKPHMGDQYFGKMAAQSIPEYGGVFSDGGFDAELIPTVQKLGRENVFVVQFTAPWADSFVGDSRNFLNTPTGVATIRLINDKTPKEFVNTVLAWIKETDDEFRTTTYHPL